MAGARSHPDSEQLALLAMDSPVDEAVAEHVRECAECRADLALLKSLMAGGAEGSDASDWHLDGASDDGVDEDVLAAAMEAQADGPQGSAIDEPVSQTVGLGDTQPPSSVPAGGRSRVGLTVAAVVLVALLVLGAVLLWR
ncbi:MAG: hypothetical protein ACH36H_04460 [Candidatus Nanopelagicales bacterium]